MDKKVGGMRARLAGSKLLWKATEEDQKEEPNTSCKQVANAIKLSVNAATCTAAVIQKWMALSR